MEIKTQCKTPELHKVSRCECAGIHWTDTRGAELAQKGRNQAAELARRKAGFSTGDIVIFAPREGESAEGMITRVWDKPASNPYVTIRTDEDRPRTFVRCSSAVACIMLGPESEAQLRSDHAELLASWDEMARPAHLYGTGA